MKSGAGRIVIRTAGIIGCTVMVFVAACKDNPTASNTPRETVIGGTSFENGGKGNRDGWIGDSAAITYSSDVPTGGGQWSLELTPQWIPQEGSATTFITGESGTHVYRFSVWMKSPNAWLGHASIGKWTRGALASPITDTSSITDWHLLQLTDTLTMATGDTLALRLSAGTTEVARGTVLFDLVSLVRVE